MISLSIMFISFSYFSLSCLCFTILFSFSALVSKSYFLMLRLRCLSYCLTTLGYFDCSFLENENFVSIFYPLLLFLS